MTTVTRSQYPVYVQVTRIKGAKRSAVRKSFETPKLDPKKYELRVKRATAHSKLTNVLDEVYLSDVSEIVLDTLSYPNTALVGLKIKLTDQLSGLPKVTYVNGGKVVQVYGKKVAGSVVDEWYSAPSKNPAWIVWDILTNRRYGGGMSSSRLDFVAFKSWAAYCEVVGFEWNGVIDTEMNVWDACQLVLRVGHAQIVNVGTRWTVVVEKPMAPTMMFSVANMVEGSYKETWLGTADRANEIDVSFFDRTDSHKQRTIKIYDPVALTAGEKQRSSAITLYGVTDYEMAYREAQFQLNLNRFILKTVEFSAPLEAVACSVGDLIYVQHDMTEWAVAGRFEVGSTTSVMKLDRPVAMAPGKQYKLLVTHDTVLRGTGSIYNVAGTSLFLTGYTGLDRARRIKIGSRDLRVAGVFDQGTGSYGVVVDNATGITAGMTYELWDTDIIEEYDVVNFQNNASELILQTPASFAPVQYGKWMFGDAEKVKSVFRIKSVTGSQGYTRDIVAVEHRPEIYDLTRYGTNVPVIPPKNAVIGPVRSLVAYEETYVYGASIVSKLVASWQTPMVGLYAGSDVYVKRNGGAFEKTSSAKVLTSATIDAAKGDVVTVKVVAFDIFDKRSQYELAPESTYTVIGEVTDINVGDVTGAGFVWSGRDCKISWRYNATTHSYEFGSEPTGGDAGALDPHFKDYEIRVYEQDGKTLRRTEYTTDNSYVYIYDKNFADGLKRHLVFEIRMRDTFNNLGNPATLTAYNPPPTILTVDQKTSWESATLAYTHSGDPDFVGTQVWLSQNQADLTDLTTADSKIVFSGPDAAILLSNLMFNADYYFRIAAFDAFGKTELVPTAALHFKTKFLDVTAIAEGVLTDSVLVPALRTRINLIDGPATMAGSVAAGLLAEAVARGTAVSAESTVRKAAEASIATSVTAVQASVASANALIATQQSTQAGINSSMASSIGTLSSTVNGYSAAIQTTQSVVNGLSGQYTVKIDNNGYVSGYGLASTTVNGVPTSEFIINAAKFAVVVPGYASTYPFTIGLVDGAYKTIIKDALIGDASISTAKIGALQVNTLQIAGNAVTVPVGHSGWATIPSLSIYLSDPGTIFVTVMANALANGGGNAGDLFVAAVCDEVSGPAVGVSMVDGYSGSATAIGSFAVGAGWHTVRGNSYFSASGGIARYIGSTGIFAIGVKK